MVDFPLQCFFFFSVGNLCLDPWVIRPVPKSSRWTQVAAANRVVDTNALTDIVPNYAEADIRTLKHIETCWNCCWKKNGSERTSICMANVYS